MTTRPTGSPSTGESSARLAAPPEVLDDDPPVTRVMTTHVRGELRRQTRELPPTARASDAARQMSLDAADAVLVADN
jgi:hypothetical protein